MTAKKPRTKKSENPDSERSATRTRARKANVTFSTEIADRFCEALVTAESVGEACSLEGMPSESTVYLWILRHPEFKVKYEAAWTAGCERMANELLKIVDDSSRDRIQRKNENSGKTETVTDHEHIQRSRLRFDARRWLLSKRNRRSFGDQVVDFQANLTPGFHSILTPPVAV